MKLVISKILTAVVLLVLTLMFSLVPYVLVLRGTRSVVSARRRDGVIAYLNCLAGGVFLGTLLLHILTEGSEEFDKYKEAVGLDTEFPLFNLFVAGGFFLVALVELVVHSQLHQHQPRTYSVCDDGHSTVHGAVGEVVHPTEDVMAAAPVLQLPNGTTYGSTDDGSGTHRTNDGSSQYVFHYHKHHHTRDPSEVSAHANPNDRNKIDQHPSKARTDSETVGLVKKPGLVSPQRPVADHHHQEREGHHEIHGQHPAGVRAFLLLAALSFHTIFDGLAVGLQKSETEVWSVFAAITIHKSIIAFCLGLELFQSNMQSPGKATLWLVMFGLMSPLGIGIGIGLTSDHINETAKLLASSVLQGIAGGTFLYVTFLEILCVHIGHHSSGKFLYVFFAIVGFSLMAASKLLDHDDD